MQNLFTKMCCVSWNKLFFSCCLVCISMTRAFWCQYALENKVGIPASDAYRRPTPGIDIPCRWYNGFRRHREVCAKPVYQRATPQGCLLKTGIPASNILRVNKTSSHYSSHPQLHLASKSKQKTFMPISCPYEWKRSRQPLYLPHVALCRKDNRLESIVAVADGFLLADGQEPIQDLRVSQFRVAQNGAARLDWF